MSREAILEEQIAIMQRAIETLDLSHRIKSYDVLLTFNKTEQNIAFVDSLEANEGTSRVFLQDEWLNKKESAG